MIEQSNVTGKTLAQYIDGLADLEKILLGLSAKELGLSLAPDSWSIRQIIHHLADGDEIWRTCIKAALGNEQGLFTLRWYWDKPQLEWSQNWHYAGRDIQLSLAILRANRRQMVELINLSPGALEKSIRLQKPDGGEEAVTVGYIIGMQGRHVLGHIEDIRRILQASHDR